MVRCVVDLLLSVYSPPPRMVTLSCEGDSVEVG
jgi:hypothetical protein